MPNNAVTLKQIGHCISLCRSLSFGHEFHETRHSVTLYFLKKRLQTMLWHHKARVNSHQRWKQMGLHVCFHLWCEKSTFARKSTPPNPDLATGLKYEHIWSQRLVGVYSNCYQIIKGTLPRKSTWALNVQFSEKTTMVPFIWMWNKY